MIARRIFKLLYAISFCVMSLFFLTGVALAQLDPAFTEIKPNIVIPIPTLTPFTPIAQPDASGIISVRYLGEYIEGVYRYAVGIAGIFAVALIMWGGMKWIFAGGDTGKIGEAKKTINNAVIGLVLVLGSYLLLYTINPETVRFKALKLAAIKREALQEIDEGDPLPETAARPPGVSTPTWTHATFNCTNPPSEAGVIPASTTVPIPATLLRIKTNPNTRVHGSMILGLQKLNNALDEFSRREGVNYTIGIGSGYRPYEAQVKLWCGPETNCFTQYSNTAIRKKFCAVPGFSNHGQGYAIDASLFRDGKKITAGNSKTQCTANKLEDVAKFADIFYAADNGWVRYEAEIWHFEFNPTETSQRGKYRGLPKKCAQP